MKASEFTTAEVCEFNANTGAIWYLEIKSTIHFKPTADVKVEVDSWLEYSARLTDTGNGKPSDWKLEESNVKSPVSGWPGKQLQSRTDTSSYELHEATRDDF